MTGWVRSQSMIVGRSIRPSTSMGTSGGTALTNTNRPGPARGGVTESSTTTSASPIPPWYWSGVRTSSETWGSVRRTFSRKRLPGLTRRTAIFRGGGRAADVRLERHLFLGDRLAVELEPERERLRVVGVVHERDERLVVESPVVVFPDREAG